MSKRRFHTADFTNLANEVASDISRVRAASDQLSLITRRMAVLEPTDRRVACVPILEMTAGFLEARGGAVILLDRSEVLLVATGELDEGAMLRPPAVAMWRSLMEDKSPRCVPTSQLEPSWPERPTGGILVVPIEMYERSIGLFCMTQRGVIMQRIDLEFMASVSAVCALAIASADSVARQRELAKQAQARREAEALAAARQVEIDTINAEVERLFYAVSHDLRAPVRALMSLAKFIHEDLEAGEIEQVKANVALLDGRAQRLDTMFTDLLSYARIGRTTSPPEDVDVNDIMHEIVTSLVHVPKGFRVGWQELPRLRTQRSLLSQVLLNLVGNAIKHHDCGAGRIVVSARAAEGNAICFSVADDGPGIPEEDHDKAFTLFQTLKRRDEVEGSGMGLALVRKVVKTNGGDVVIASNKPRGAVISFTWPRA